MIRALALKRQSAIANLSANNGHTAQAGRTTTRTMWVLFAALAMSPMQAWAIQEAVDAPHDYINEVAPIFDRYCTACHNADDREAGLSLESYRELLEGGERGPAMLAGDASASRLIRMLTGEVEPIMPPDDMEGPTDEELGLLISWITAGAAGPEGDEPSRTQLLVPTLDSSAFSVPMTAADWHPTSNVLAIARGSSIEVSNADGGLAFSVDEFSGRVNSLHFSRDGKWLIAAGGISGVVGVVEVWDSATGESLVRIEGHRDSLYAADINPAGTQVATTGYDKRIILWNVEDGQLALELRGHNQPVFDLRYDPAGKVLLSASADETLKLWRVTDGQRLDTLGQPLAEQYVGRFTPDGNQIVGAGADNRIRVWDFVSTDTPRSNPMVLSRFAHEGAISHLDFSNDGSRMVSVSEDRTIKVWDTTTWTELELIEEQPDIVTSMALSFDGSQLVVGRIDGTVQRYAVAADVSHADTTAEMIVPTVHLEMEMVEVAEAEPNDLPEVATRVQVPAKISAVIHSDQDSGASDRDLFRFNASQGDTWIIEVNAQRQGSPLDSRIEVLDENGERVLRARLQAIRDSYFTFRGKDSNTSDDFRVHNWEEMELNEYLYANGEVVRLWLYPRGPDSGYKVYPGFGSRHSFFDTTPLSHALQSPCFIVQPISINAEVIPSGLPVFPVYFENDDDGKRQLGSDSKLLFTAPQDGVYYVRVSDTRGFDGESFKYDLHIRPPAPNFSVALEKANPKVAPGGAREFILKAQRFDYFEDEIIVEIENVPPGFHVTSPVIIQAGQYQAIGAIWADADVAAPSEEQMTGSTVSARAMIGGEVVRREINSLGRIELNEPNVIVVKMLELNEDARRRATSADPLANLNIDEGEVEAVALSLDEGEASELTVLEIHPGETVVAQVRIERNGFTGRVSFGKEDSGRNLPHGVFVDNIGLNGLMIIEGHVERSFFVTAADWVEPQERLFHLRTEEQGGQCSFPVLLRVVERE